MFFSRMLIVQKNMLFLRGIVVFILQLSRVHSGNDSASKAVALL